MPWVDSDGVNIWYNIMGEGTPLLLCNGWGGSSDSSERASLILRAT